MELIFITSVLTLFNILLVQQVSGSNAETVHTASEGLSPPDFAPIEGEPASLSEALFGKEMPE